MYSPKTGADQLFFTIERRFIGSIEYRQRRFATLRRPFRPETVATGTSCAAMWHHTGLSAQGACPTYRLRRIV